jgi:hypothetical protein
MNKTKCHYCQSTKYNKAKSVKGWQQFRCNSCGKHWQQKSANADLTLLSNKEIEVMDQNSVDERLYNWRKGYLKQKYSRAYKKPLLYFLDISWC